MLTNILDKVGAIGAVVAGMCVPCCFPFLGVIGSALGLGFLVSYAAYFMSAIQVLVVLSLVGAIIAYARRRRMAPLLLNVVCTSTMLYSINTEPDPFVLGVGLGGLLLAAFWNSIEAKRCTAGC